MRLARFALVVALLGALFGGIALETPVLFAGSGEREVDRVRGYEVGAGLDPSFGLPGDDVLLRVVTNALVGGDLEGEGSKGRGSPSPSQVQEDAYYGVTVEIERPGAPIQVRTIHQKSHRTGPRTGSADPCFDSAGTPIADSRHVDLVLDPPAPAGTVVRVHGLGATRSIVRAWSWQPREGEERARRKLALDVDQRQRLGDPVGVLSWDHLVPAERAAWTGGHFARLAASGRPGTEHAPRDFFVQKVQPPETDEEVEPFVLASPQTWLVQGPAHAAVRVTSSPDTLPATVELHRTAGDDALLGQFEVGPGAPPFAWEGDLPAGVQTLVLRSSTPTHINLALDVPAASLLPPQPVALGAAPDPSTVTLRATPVRPGVDAVMDAELPRDPEARTVQVEVWSTAPTDPALTVTLVGASRTTAVPVRVTLPPNAYDVALTERREWPPGETPLRGPTRLRVLMPADTREVRVGSDTDVLVRFLVPFNSSDEDPGPPPLTKQVGVGDGPAARSWVRAKSPTEEVAILVKARVEPVPPPPPPPPTWIAVSLDPLGLVQRFEALERVSGELTGRLLTEVTGGVVRVRAGAGQTRARWSFEVVDDAVLGTSVPFSLDGQPGGTIRAALTRGTVRLPILSPGDHTVEAHPPPGLRLFVNLPPAAGEPSQVLRARTVWKVSGPVRLSVRTDARGPRALNIVVYDPSGSPRTDTSLTATVDGGAPSRRSSGVYTRSTPARRTWTLPGPTHPDAATLVDGARERIGLPRTVILPLGDDLVPGVHTIVVTPSRPLYVRFFAVMPPDLSASLPTTWAPESANE